MKFTKKDLNHILNNFDFKQVHKCMKKLNWRWYPKNEVPTIKELKQLARQHLKYAIQDNGKKYFTSSGGFTVEKTKKFLELRFEITSLSTLDLLNE